MDEQFKKAQKPWSKLLLNVNKTKADYHAACKAEKTAVNIERNAGGDSSLSQDHVSFIKSLKTCNLDMFFFRQLLYDFHSNKFYNFQ